MKRGETSSNDATEYSLQEVYGPYISIQSLTDVVVLVQLVHSLDVLLY
jgi:hypothetical protein